MSSKMIAKLGIGAGAGDHGLRYSKVKAPPVLDWSDNPKGRVITTNHTELPKVRTAPTNPGKKKTSTGAASLGIDVTSGVERFDYGDEDTGEEWERHESLHDDTVSGECLCVKGAVQVGVLRPAHLTVSLYLCSSGGKARGMIQGPLRGTL